MLSLEALQNLRFQCQECGKCCTGKDGYVLLTKEDIYRITDFLKINETEFFKVYTKWTHTNEEDFLSLGDLPNDDCAFLKDNHCQIYPARPLQCRVYPYWPRVIKSSYSWKNEKNYCPGIGEGNLIDVEVVKEFIIAQRNAKYIQKDDLKQQ